MSPVAPQRFRKKPVEIEAMQWDGTVLGARQIINRFAGQNVQQGEDHMGPTLYISTLEGTMAAGPGDWIICGVAGEFYPCKDAIFRATYEEVPRGCFRSAAVTAGLPEGASSGEARRCPDDGACHHECRSVECFRVRCCGPLSDVFPGDRWPAGAVEIYGLGSVS